MQKQRDQLNCRGETQKDLNKYLLDMKKNEEQLGKEIQEMGILEQQKVLDMFDELGWTLLHHASSYSKLKIL